jgi:hypothetical protein
LTRHHLTLLSGARSRYPLKRPVFSSDVSVQTETVAIIFHSPTRIESNKLGLDDQESALTAADLAAILKWSKDISSDINLSAGNPFLLTRTVSFLKSNFDDSTQEVGRDCNWWDFLDVLDRQINPSYKF